MKARLLHLCVAAALCLGGWGGALAAALCASGDCCAQKTEAGRGAQAHARHDGHASAATHEESCDGERDMTGEKDAGRADGESDADAGVAASSAREEGFCAHCVGRSENAPPRESPAFRKSGQGHEGRAEVASPLTASTSTHFVNSITLKQGAPPGGPPHRHLLLSVFRI